MVNKTWSPYAILCVGLLLSIFVSLNNKRNLEEREVGIFIDECNQAALKIQTNLNAYSLVLRGGAALFAASDTVTRHEWKSYIESFNMNVGMTGIQGYGYAQVIPKNQLAAHIKNIRSQGFSDYTVYPAGERDLYTSIIYLEPFSGLNLKAFGYDMYSESVRRMAMAQARDTGMATLSGKVKLVQEGDDNVQAGALMYMPVYLNDLPINTVEQRRLAIVGWIYSPYRITDLMNGMLQQLNATRKSDFSLQIYDGNEVSSANLIFNNQSGNHASQHSKFYHLHAINFNNHQWLLVFDVEPAYVGINYAEAWSSLLTGVILSSLLFALMRSMARTQSNAMRIAEDLTREIRLSKKMLEESEFRWKFAIEGAGDGVWDWNVQTNEAQYTKRWKEMLGYTDDDILPKHEEWANRIHPDDQAYVFAAVQDYLAGNSELYVVEFRLRCKDESYKWILTRGMLVSRTADNQPLRMLGTHTDISSLKQAEENAVEYAAQLNAIFSLSPDGFVSFDMNRHVKYVNTAFERMTGLISTQVNGLTESAFSNLLKLKCVEQSSFLGIAALRLMQKARTGGLNDLRQKIELTGANQRILEIGLREASVGNISQVLYMRDVTHETEIGRIKSEFLSTAAHELRTPMASIYGFAELLQEQQFEPDAQHELLGIILRQSKLMATILDELLDLARIEARRGKDFTVTRINVDQLLREAATEFTPPNDRHTPNIKNIDKSLWVNADRIKLIQVINNVLSNAYKYSPKGGEVDIEVISPALQSAIVIAQPISVTKPMLIGIRISDRGIGMTPDQISHIFERFYRADTSGSIPGTGLGMSIVHEIIELHNGNITIDSVFGEGTAVTIWLPVAIV